MTVPPPCPRAAARRRWSRAGAAALALAGAACQAAAETPLTPCRIAGVRNSVQCGAVQRALDPARPDGPKIDVHFVVVPAIARRKLPDPVFLLAGGPGQSAIDLASGVMAALNRLANRRDIVFVDQRGTGRSAPLACKAADREPLADAADTPTQIRRMADCRRELQALPYLRAAGDLRFFSTVLAMQDLDAVRQRLGAQHINLLGASYGTRAALEYQRQFPARVRRSVIDGVAPPDMVLPASFAVDGQAAFESLLAACATDPVCAGQHPTLRADWSTLLASLPQPVSLAHPLTGRAEKFVLTVDMLQAAVRGPLYSPALAAGLPAAITEAARGNFAALLGLSASLASRRAAKVALGMHFSVVCAEDVPLLAPAAEPGAGDGFARLYRGVCADWPRAEVPQAFYSVPASASPVLLLSGGLDPATPPRHAERVARALGALATHVVVANAGHGVMGLGCVRDLIYRFVDAADDRDAGAVDASCAAKLPRPPAFQPLVSANQAVR